MSLQDVSWLFEPAAAPLSPRCYLDHAATAPLRPEAREAMAPWWELTYGNEASGHSEGRRARRALAEARASVAALVGARPEEVTFTSGATEASNLAVRGGAHLRRASGKRVVATAIEHAATRKSCEALAAEGYQVTYLSVDRAGRVNPAGLTGAIPHGTSVVSVIAGHNELGTIQPLYELAEAAHAVGALFHLDAVQAAGYLDLSDVPWDLLSLSAHKLGGPQGVGALIRRDQCRLGTLMVGGSQERGLRPGTVPIALAAGFGAACEVARAHRETEPARLIRLRDALGAYLRDRRPELLALGPALERPEDALPHILALGVPGFTGDELVYALDVAGVAASSSSACLSGARSQTLDAIGLSEDMTLLRLSLGWTSEQAAVMRAGEAIAHALAALDRQSPFERRKGPLARRAEEAGVVMTDAHWEAAECVFSFHQTSGVLPGARALAKTLAGARLEDLYPFGLSTLALWLGLPVPRGGCRPYAG